MFMRDSNKMVSSVGAVMIKVSCFDEQVKFCSELDPVEANQIDIECREIFHKTSIQMMIAQPHFVSHNNLLL